MGEKNAFRKVGVEKRSRLVSIGDRSKRLST